MTQSITYRIWLAGMLTAGLLCSPVWASMEGKDKSWADKDAKMKMWKEKKEKFYEELGITEEQKERLKAHREQHREQKKGLHQQIRDKKELLRTELNKDQIDKTRVRQINEELKGLIARKMDMRLEGILGVRDILMPDQFQAFQSKMEKFKDKKRDKYRGED